MAGPQLQAVIFDVDGTLVDSERDGHRVAFNQAFAAAGLPDRWDVETYGALLEVTGGERRLRHYLRGPDSSLAEATDDEEVGRLAAELHRWKTQCFTDMVNDSRIPARPGVERLLDELDHAGIPMAIATTGTSEWVRPLIDLRFGADRFVTVVTGEDVAVRKPDPAAYLTALRVMGVAPRATVAVEDSGPGLQSARHAGLPCVVVANPYTRLDQVERADVVTDGFGQPSAPATVRSDPHRAVADGVIDVACLRRLVERAR